jgi:hypothetical protein
VQRNVTCADVVPPSGLKREIAESSTQMGARSQEQSATGRSGGDQPENLPRHVARQPGARDFPAENRVFCKIILVGLRWLLEIANADPFAYRCRLPSMPGGRFLVGKILEHETYAYGLDAQTGEFGNLVRKAIIDPTKVVRMALQDGASIAGLLITTEAMVAEKPKKETPMPVKR